MAKITFNQQQMAAIETSGNNILVAAGAGSGKTAALVERIIRQISRNDDPVDIDCLLSLTFTNAAASEMRQRIDEALTALLKKRGGEDQWLLRQLALLPQAHISTIHSFCLDVVRHNFYRLGLDNGFRIPSETEGLLLRDEAIDNFFEAEFAHEESCLPLISDTYGCGNDQKKLARLLTDLHSFSSSQPHPRQWLKDAAAVFACPQTIDDLPFADFVFMQLKRSIQQSRNYFGLALTTRDIADKCQQQLMREDEMLGSLLQISSMPQLIKSLAGCKFDRWLPIDKNTPLKDKERFAFLRNAGRDVIKELQKKYCRRSLQMQLADLRQAAPLLSGLCELTIAYDEAITQEKRRRNLVDFSDMEHFCLQILEDEESGVADGLRSQFVEILVDEYQDINPVQERILQLLQNGSNCFAVGDVKQSIYRFRMAEPGLFLSKYQQYALDQGGIRIDLNLNYRSSCNIINCINYIFCRLMSEETAEIAYDQDAALHAGSNIKGDPCELWLLNRPEADQNVDSEGGIPELSENGDQSDSAGIKDARSEAQLIGKRIRQLCNQQHYNYRDIAILLRSPRNTDQEIVKQLLAMGIPAVADKSPSYLDQPEVALIISCLKIIDNPLQDIPFTAALRSPLAGFTSEELVQIRFIDKQQSFYGCLQQIVAGEDVLAVKAAAFLEQLAAWRKQAGKGHLADLIWQLCQTRGFYQLSGALPGGRSRQANLRALHQQACEYERSSFSGLSRFINLLDDALEKNSTNESERLLSESADVVRVMSIHKSKGLQFSVVFVASLGRRLQFPQAKEDVVWHKDFGIGAKIIDIDRRIKFNSFARAAIVDKLHQEAIAEDLRTLYVALTRAASQLILVGTISKTPNKIEEYFNSLAVSADEQIFSGSVMQSKGSFLEWLLMVLLHHPDAAELRERYDCDCQPISDDQSRWRIYFDQQSSIEQQSDAAVTVDAHLQAIAEQKELPPTPQAEMINQIMSYRYPFAEVCRYPIKWTVSELNKTASFADDCQESCLIEEAALDEADLPKLAANERGSIYHLLLEKINVSGCQSVDDVTDQIKAFTDQGILKTRDTEIIDSAAIVALFTSPLGQRMIAAPQVYREVPFTYALPAREQLDIAKEDDMLIVQGMIDAVFKEEDALVIIDYKTGSRGKSEQQILATYARQLAYYRRAIADIWQLPVKEAYLYMIDTQQIIAVPEVI